MDVVPNGRGHGSHPHEPLLSDAARASAFVGAVPRRGRSGNLSRVMTIPLGGRALNAWFATITRQNG